MNSNIMTFSQIKNLIANKNKCFISTSNDNIPYCQEVYYTCDIDCNTITIIINEKECSKLIEQLSNNNACCLLFSKGNCEVNACGIATVDSNTCNCGCCNDVTCFIELNNIRGKNISCNR